MRKKIIAAVIFSALISFILCAFTYDENSSVKSLTKPYITTYECVSARFGKEDILQKYDFIKITFLNDKELEVSYKYKNGKKHCNKCNYYYDDGTGTFSAEMGILGFRFKQQTVIENGKFTLVVPILGKPLILNFSS